LGGKIPGKSHLKNPPEKSQGKMPGKKPPQKLVKSHHRKNHAAKI
jgi:hypothetical protein